MPVATVSSFSKRIIVKRFFLLLKMETKSVMIDDDLTDLSWLIQMNNSNGKQRHAFINEQKHSKIERMNKPLAVVNGQTNRSSVSTISPNYQYFNGENQCYSDHPYPNPSMKRKYDPSLTYDHQQPNKRFHCEPTFSTYPSVPISSDSFYYDPHPPPAPVQQQRPSRYMLLKNDPTLSETIPISTNFHEPMKLLEHDNLYSDDIEHLLDIFKNEVEMIGFDPVASTSTGDCLSSNEFCSY